MYFQRIRKACESKLHTSKLAYIKAEMSHSREDEEKFVPLETYEQSEMSYKNGTKQNGTHRFRKIYPVGREKLIVLPDSMCDAGYDTEALFIPDKRSVYFIALDIYTYASCLRWLLDITKTELMNKQIT